MTIKIFRNPRELFNVNRQSKTNEHTPGLAGIPSYEQGVLDIYQPSPPGKPLGPLTRYATPREVNFLLKARVRQVPMTETTLLLRTPT